MKLIKPKAELLLQQSGLEGVYEQIELAGRTCYRSTNKITEDSAKPFVDRMIKSNHLAMLEHGTVYLIIKWWHIFKFFKYLLNPYSKVRKFKYITTNLRVIKEHNWDNDLKYICEPTEYHEKRYTFRLTTSIGVTRELNRHRVNSIAEMSTRYCNYSKDKFGREVTFCIPSWLNIPEGDAYWYDGINYRIQPKNDPNFEAAISVRPGDYFTKEQAEELDVWLNSLDVAEHHYMNLISKGWQPQQAREVLPLCTATEIIHTAYTSDWKHFFDLRYFGKTGAPHPNMVELTGLMAKEVDKYGIWKELCNQNVEMAN